MWFVYILYSKKDGKLYVGCTENLEDRLKRHKNGAVVSTKNRRPLILIYNEKFQKKAEAFDRERFLKSLWAGKIKKKIKAKYLKSITAKSDSFNESDRPNILDQ